MTINRRHAHHTYLSMINDRTISRSYTLVYGPKISCTRLIDAIVRVASHRWFGNYEPHGIPHTHIHTRPLFYPCPSRPPSLSLQTSRNEESIRRSRLSVRSPWKKEAEESKKKKRKMKEKERSGRSRRKSRSRRRDGCRPWSSGARDSGQSKREIV